MQSIQDANHSSTTDEAARAKAIDALCGLLDETQARDVLDDPPEQPDGTPSNQPRRHRAKGRALRFSLRLRAALALLRITHTKPSASPRQPRAAREPIAAPHSAPTLTAANAPGEGRHRSANPHCTGDETEISPPDHPSDRGDPEDCFVPGIPREKRDAHLTRNDTSNPALHSPAQLPQPDS